MPASVAALAFVLALSVGPALGRALAAGPRVGGRAALALTGAALTWGLWHLLFEALVQPVPAPPASAAAWGAVAAAFAALFVVQTVMQTQPTGRLAAWLHPRLFGAFFIDEWFTRLTFRLWPPRLQPRATSTSVAPAATGQELPSC